MVVVMHPDDERNLLLLRKDLCGWRLVRRLTQDQMSDSIGAPRHTMGDLERGMPGAMTFRNLHKWARCLDFTLMWRFTDLPACKATPEMMMLDAMACSGKGDVEGADRLLLGMMLRQLRKDLKVSQGTIGAVLGVDFQSLRRWEIGNKDLNIFQVYAYARALGGSVAFTAEDLKAPAAS